MGHERRLVHPLVAREKRSAPTFVADEEFAAHEVVAADLVTAARRLGAPRSRPRARGLRDLESGADSGEARLVQVGAPKLRPLGIDLQTESSAASPEHRLYARLSADEAGNAPMGDAVGGHRLTSTLIASPARR